MFQVSASKLAARRAAEGGGSDLAEGGFANCVIPNGIFANCEYRKAASEFGTFSKRRLKETISRAMLCLAKQR
jgi:hypothetical protein